MAGGHPWCPAFCVFTQPASWLPAALLGNCPPLCSHVCECVLVVLQVCKDVPYTTYTTDCQQITKTKTECDIVYDQKCSQVGRRHEQQELQQAHSNSRLGNCSRAMSAHRLHTACSINGCSPKNNGQGITCSSRKKVHLWEEMLYSGCMKVYKSIHKCVSACHALHLLWSEHVLPC